MFTPSVSELAMQSGHSEFQYLLIFVSTQADERAADGQFVRRRKPKTTLIRFFYTPGGRAV